MDCVIGAGRVGRTVAARLDGSRLYRRAAEAELDGCTRLLLATPDDVIAAVCAEVAPRLAPDCAVVHFSGATTVHALDTAAGPRACVHPMQTVDPARGSDQLEGAFAAVTGDWAVGERLAGELGMIPFALADEHKPVYHAAAFFGSNSLVTLTAVAVELLGRCGIGRAQALEILRPLQERTLAAAGDPPTGPVARGDVGTVARQLDAIGPDLAPLYRELARASLPLVSESSREAVRGVL